MSANRGHGPRKQSKWAGVYSTHGLADAQPGKPPSEAFFVKRLCRFNRHSWIRGLDNWVCTRCGHVSPISQNPQSPPPLDP